MVEVVYSREQIEKERAAMGDTDGEPLDDAPWRLIGIKGQSVPYEIPMYVYQLIHQLTVDIAHTLRRHMSSPA